MKLTPLGDKRLYPDYISAKKIPNVKAYGILFIAC